MMKFLVAVGAFIIMIIPLTVLSILGLLWRTWWLYPAWAWFMVPLGLPVITFWHCAGLLLLVNILTMHFDHHKDERKVDWYSYLGLFIQPMVIWVMLRWLAGGR